MKKVWFQRIALLTVCAFLLICGLSACKQKETFEFEVSEPAPEVDDHEEKAESEQETPENEEENEKEQEEMKVEQETPMEQEKEDQVEKPQKEEPFEEKTDSKENEDPDKKEPADDEESSEPKGPTDYSNYLTVVSYNIKNGNWKKTAWAGLKENITGVNADIIGLQECDNDTHRSAKTCVTFPNQVQELAHDMGYEYWYFAKTIDLEQGGTYGHGILSRFPIKNSKVTFFKNQKGEVRNMERHVLDVNGTNLVFYNTHLNGTIEQFNELVAAIEKDYEDGEYVLVTGDFNLRYTAMQGWLDPYNFFPLNGTDTFNNGLQNVTPIDNIIISRNITEYYTDETTGIGVKYLDAELEDSDHPMIYSHIKLPENK